MIPAVVARVGSWTLERERVWRGIRVKVERIIDAGDPFTVPLLRYLARPVVTAAIDERILGDAAAAEGFVPDSERAVKHVDSLFADEHGRREIEHFLRENGLSVEEYTERLALRTAITDWVTHRFIEPQVIDEDDVRALHERRRDELAVPGTITVDRILAPRVGREQPPDAAGAMLLARIREAIAGGMPFQEAPSAVAVDGKAAYPARYEEQRLARTALPPSVRAVLEALDPGEVSAVVVLPDAFAILRWRDPIPARLRHFPEVADELRAHLRTERGRAAFTVYYETLRRARNVVIQPPLEDPTEPWPGHRQRRPGF